MPRRSAKPNRFSNFQHGIRNVIAQYQPSIVGVATTCLAETIGEDMPGILREFHRSTDGAAATPVVHVSTAAYRGTHIDGFHSAVRAMVEQLAASGTPTFAVNLFPGMVSAADLRHLKEIFETLGLGCRLLPDYSETMDGEIWSEYEKLQSGVTPVLCASGGRSKCFEKCLREAAPDLPAETLVKEGFDFAEIAETAPALKPDFLLGNSKGYSLARKLNVPLIRVGFPVHDRIGGQRLHHLGYRGAQELFDRIVNALMESKQGNSSIGYSYL